MQAAEETAAAVRPKTKSVKCRILACRIIQFSVEYCDRFFLHAQEKGCIIVYTNKEKCKYILDFMCEN